MSDYTYENCEVDHVIDGDTVVLLLRKDFVMLIDFGFNIKDEVHLHKSSVQTFRLLGINTPEVVGTEKPSGLLAKEALQGLLKRGKLTVTSHGKDKYGRWLGTILVNLEDGSVINVNEWLLQEGYAKPYMQ